VAQVFRACVNFVVYNDSVGASHCAANAMAELQTIPDLLEKAETAAAAGDLNSADELLRTIARIQEHELGSQHPDLANTLNNLAIVAEKTGRPTDAEGFYRRAVAIASASLAPDDPMLAASRQNLEDFCRAQGIPIDKPAVIAPAPDKDRAEPDQPVPSRANVVADAKTPVPERSRPSPPFAKVVIAIVMLVIAALFVMRPWSSREMPVATPVAEPAAPPASEPARSQVPQQPPAAPAGEASQPAPPPQRVDSARAGGRPGAADGASAPVGLVTAQLCRTLSTSGSWRCDPAGDSVASGQLVLYTRVKSSRPTVVVHRWYRGTTLRRSVELEVRANPNEGYRTFSRQTVDPGEEWRVEVRSASGELLHEQRVSVRPR